ncbi:Arv1-like family-domain-containing protein [Gorgonomyces haynaldii]|nr:Arv1-like family-domain-containing protein [Gorgonomyces haynaldii]
MFQSKRCIECGEKVSQLYVEYGKGNIKLQECPQCLKFADKYIEYDLTTIFIDMVLLKHQVYRHMLFNRLEYTPRGTNPSMIRFGILLVLFDVYMKWHRLDRLQQPIVLGFALHLQYLWMLGFCTFEFLLFHLGIRLVASLLVKLSIGDLNRLSMGLILSSFGKILLLVMVIWEYGNLDPSFLVNSFVLICNFEALAVMLNVSLFQGLLILSSGIGSKILALWMAQAVNPGFKQAFNQHL